MKEAESLDKRYPKLSAAVLDLAKVINQSFTMNVSLFTCPSPWGAEEEPTERAEAVKLAFSQLPMQQATAWVGSLVRTARIRQLLSWVTGETKPVISRAKIVTACPPGRICISWCPTDLSFPRRFER